VCVVNNTTIAVLSVALLAGCAAAPDSELAPAPSAAEIGAAADPSQLTAANAPQVQIENFEDEATCRREAPTGSRISVRTCEPTAPKDPLADYITRDQVELMRQAQIMQEQARQAREAAELARVVGGPR
jgi:hypothetical protein